METNSPLHSGDPPNAKPPSPPPSFEKNECISHTSSSGDPMLQDNVRTSSCENRTMIMVEVGASSNQGNSSEDPRAKSL